LLLGDPRRRVVGPASVGPGQSVIEAKLAQELSAQRIYQLAAAPVIEFDVTFLPLVDVVLFPGAHQDDSPAPGEG
jgi:hypothetical protein